ncbi:RagB/SusD family nutrient uptake outer membrane protein [Chitinophaga parva]|uniref:RagB/SusD family nutrient uptake outer membrane protein n=1 Tax=Chitinophaga parva TaxID=2169414 RepID=A0A2T7BJL4_9BACT|nr:RagB/SusD family nutrient uptake outer membrane protein [Chitinophaga parva]PUZ26476.1 RagB/SusD family nutrient uptake outer membrane protein [Chitinophaga parva]
MKKGLLIFGSLVMLSACNKLVENPNALISQQQYYKTQADAIAAANAVYNTLNSAAGDFPMYGRQLNLMTDNASDNHNFSPSNTNPDVRAMGTVTYVPANGRILKNWQQHYFGINRANLAIDNIPNIPEEKFTDQRIQARTINEAKFLRGLLYFNLVRLFGDVPLILHNPTSVDITALQVPRTSRDAVYRQVIADLTDATNLPKSYTGADVGRATSGAAHALLAKVYVTRHDWQHALTELQAVLNGGYGYGLFSDYKDAFQKSTKNGIEHIFSVQFQTNGGEANSVQYLSQSFNSFNTGTYPIDIISDSSVVKLFPAGDTRIAVTFFDRQYNPATGDTVYWKNPYAPYLNKFVDYSISPLINQSLSGINFPVIRYAEVLLLYAEVLNEINGGPTAEGYNAINQVRQRAHTGNLVTGLNQHDFRDSLFAERRREFIQEGQRWFDLVRQGGHTLVDALHKIAAKSAASDKDTLFPIPLQEIQLNPLLTQNPGWENN